MTSLAIIIIITMIGFLAFIVICIVITFMEVRQELHNWPYRFRQGRC